MSCCTTRVRIDVPSRAVAASSSADVAARDTGTAVVAPCSRGGMPDQEQGRSSANLLKADRRQRWHAPVPPTGFPSARRSGPWPQTLRFSQDEKAAPDPRAKSPCTTRCRQLGGCGAGAVAPLVELPGPPRPAARKSAQPHGHSLFRTRHDRRHAGRQGPASRRRPV